METLSTRFAPDETAESIMSPAESILSVCIDKMLDTRYPIRIC